MRHKSIIRSVVLALALFAPQAFADVDFFWRCEGTTLDATHDETQGDSTATASGVNMTIDAAAAFVGTNGCLSGGATTFYEFTDDAIPALATPASIVMSGGWHGLWNTAIPSAGDRGGFVVRGTASASDQLSVQWAASNEMQVRWQQSGGSTQNLTTTVFNASPNTHYKVIFRIDVPNADRRLELYDASCSLITAVEDLATDLAAGTPADLNRVFIGHNSPTDDAYYDNFLFEDTYAGVTCAELDNDSFTDFGAPPPTFTAGPTVTDTTQTTFVTTFTSDQDGTVEGVACASAIAEPSVAQVFADQCGDGSGAAAHWDETVVATVGDTETFTGLTAGTSYRLCFAIDGATSDSNTPDCLTSQVTTAVPTFSSGPSTGTLASTTAEIEATPDQSGTWYGLACTNGQTATVAQVKTGTTCSGGAAIAAFNAAVTAATPAAQTFTGLTASTTYDTFHVINNAAGDSVSVPLADVTTQAAAAPNFSAGPTVAALIDGYTVGGTVVCTGTCTVEAVACSPGDAAPTANEIEAGQCGGGNAALMNASEVWVTTVANDFALTSANKPPRLSVYVSATNGTNDSSVAPFLSQNRSPVSGHLIVCPTSIHASAEPFSVAANFNPDFAANDCIEHKVASNETADCEMSIAANAIITEAPGSGDPADSCDGKRTWDINGYEDTSSLTTALFASPADANFTTPGLICNLNGVPQENQNNALYVLDVGVAVSAINLANEVTDPNGDALTAAVTSGTPPTGTTINSAGSFSGTPSVEDEGGEEIEVTFTDECGDSIAITFTVYVTDDEVTAPNCVNDTAPECIAELALLRPWLDEGDQLLATFGYSLTVATGDIISQDPAAAAVMTASEPLDVVISLGSQLAGDRNSRIGIGAGIQ